MNPAAPPTAKTPYLRAATCRPATARMCERTNWHRGANLVVLVYLAATTALMPLHAAGIVQRWTVVHVLLLGAVTNAIVTWTTYFAAAMLHAANSSPHFAAMRLIALNVGVLGIFTGIGHGPPAITITSAAVFAAAIIAHLAALATMSRGGLGGRFTPTVRFYWAATLTLVVGMAVGVAMGIGADGTWHERVYAAHLNLNLIGWVGLAVLGTLLGLGPDLLPPSASQIPSDPRNTVLPTRARYAFQDHCAAMLVPERLMSENLEGVWLERSADVALVPGTQRLS